MLVRHRVAFQIRLAAHRWLIEFIPARANYRPIRSRLDAESLIQPESAESGARGVTCAVCVEATQS